MVHVSEQHLVWANLERLVLAWLQARADATGYTEVPTDAALPRFTIEQSGGRGSGWIDKAVDVEVKAIAETRAQMWALAGRLDSAMRDLASNGNGEGYVDDVEETFAFTPDPHPNSDLRRAIATYTLTVRPRA